MRRRRSNDAAEKVSRFESVKIAQRAGGRIGPQLTTGGTEKIVHPKAHMRHIYIFKAVFPAVFFVPYEDLPP